MKRTLVADFNNYNGHQMMISNKHGFHKDDIDQLELKMHSNNRIPSFLPLSSLELDGEISFHYQIEGFRLLQQHFRTRKITMQAYYSLILSLADGLSTCYEYMLRPECCLLDERYIFIDEDNEKVQLVYLPTKEAASEQQEHQLLALIVKWSNLVIDLDTNGYHRLLNLITSEQFQILKLRQLVLDLIHQLQYSSYGSKQDTARANDYANELSYSDSMPTNDTVSNTNARMNEAMGNSLHNKWSKNKDNLEAKQLSEVQAGIGADNISVPSIKQHVESSNATERLSWKHGLLAVIIVIAIIVSWIQLYITAPSSNSLLLCIGITLGLLALLTLMIYKPILALKEEKQYEEDDGSDRANSEISSAILASLSITKEDKSGVYNNSDVSGHNMEPSSSKQPGSSKQLGKIHYMLEEDHAHNMNNRSNEASIIGTQANAASFATVKLSEQQATELLDSLPTLIRTWHEEQQALTISDKFIIGRTDEGVHYQDTAIGVSRVHIELECERGKLTVKDVGSRNGTYLNGQLMIAYKAYPLQIGDQLQLASNEGPIYKRVS